MQSMSILVTGGGGYIGSVLVPKLLRKGYRVKVLDTFWFGEHALDAVKGNPNLTVVNGDIRDSDLLRREIPDTDVIIHLAAISNDPSADLDPELTWAVNFHAVVELIKIAKASGVHRFINASSGSVYGVKDEPNVTEDLTLAPLTLYGKTKAEGEKVIRAANDASFTTVSIRPATVCGYSPRQRLDLTVNILTSHAIRKGEITVFGGQQMRPNIHNEDMVDLYTMLITAPAEKIGGEIFNAAYENYTVAEIAEMVRSVIGPNVSICTKGTNDNRSYHLSSEKLQRVLGYRPKYTIEDGVRDLARAFADGLISDSDDPRYYNVKWMKLKGVG
ncbi:MAG: SDR family oxidoreductase [Planctomycetota bacterium]